jgi:8-oxo-dGTP diphosphatase
VYGENKVRVPRTQPRPPIERVAIGVVVRDGSVLVGRRRRPPLAGYAEFPGGKALPGESVERAVLREIREETGLEAEVERLLSRSRVTYPDGAADLHFFLCRSSGPATASTRPRDPFSWISVEVLSTLRFPAANAPVLRWLTSSRDG